MSTTSTTKKKRSERCPHCANIIWEFVWWAKGHWYCSQLCARHVAEDLYRSSS
jgi:hypothetical protein